MLVRLSIKVKEFFFGQVTSAFILVNKNINFEFTMMNTKEQGIHKYKQSNYWYKRSQEIKNG